MTTTEHENPSRTLPAPRDPRVDTRARAAEALARARDHLTGRQTPGGWWKGALDTNVTIDAEDLLLREFLGIRTERQTAESARWIRSQQRADGTWANFYDGFAELSTTVEAYIALKMAGDSPDAPHMRRAAEYIRASGGVEETRVFTRIWLALFGEWSWDDLPVMPPELMYFPRWMPLNVYDWGSWARGTIIPLTILGSLRPARSLPVDIGELRTGRRPERDTTLLSWASVFNGLDKALHVYEKRPAAGLRRAALRRAAEWIIARQEADGCWGGIQPPWVYSLLALNALGYDLSHPVMRRGIEAFETWLIREDSPEGTTRRLECCQSPVWDTVLTMIALGEAGLDGGDTAMRTAADWVLDNEIRGPGDWQVRRPGLVPSGWAFEFQNDTYADTDDTAEAILALRKVAPAGTDPRVDASVARAVSWLVGMQCKDGGWGAFDADNTQTLCTKLPFCDFGAVIDPPSADVTAHVVEALAHEGLSGTPAVRRGVVWMLRRQEADGSWFGRWGANYVYGTGAVVPALIAAGVRPEKPCVRRAVAWLKSVQNADGGWGEDLRSYDDQAAWSGRGASTASQTAWALLALLAAGDRTDATERGVAWLAEHQRADGGWDEPYYTGTGFPHDFYINYEMYRVVFPTTALARYVRDEPAGKPGGNGVTADDTVDAIDADDR